jgi:hypothetical protein
MGAAAPRLSLTATNHLLRVEVGDDNSRLPQPFEPQAAATNGRGLLIVEALAPAWSAVTEPQGKLVWFELDL